MTYKKKILFLHSDETLPLSEGLLESHHFESLTSQTDLTQYNQIVIASKTISPQFAATLPPRIRIDFWDRSQYSTIELLKLGIHISSTPTQNENLQEKFKRILGPVSEKNAQRITLTPSTQTWLSSPENLTTLLSPNNAKELLQNPTLIKELTPYLKDILVELRANTNTTGLALAKSIFAPKWFWLYDPQKCTEAKPYSKLCLSYLDADLSLGKITQDHFNMKAYWSLYSKGIQCVSTISKEMKSQLGHTNGFNTHLGFILWALGKNKEAERLIIQENLDSLSTNDAFHMASVALIIFGHTDEANYCMARLEPHYFSDRAKSPHKWFYQALAYKALNNEKKMHEALTYAQQYDPIFHDKINLLERIQTRNILNHTSKDISSFEVI